jgi:hypothetical protein
MKYYEVIAGREDWAHKKTGSGDLVVTLAEISNDVIWTLSSRWREIRNR